MRDHAGRCRADLTTVEAPHGGDRLSGDADVGILGDDRRTLAAEFHEKPLHGLAAVLHDLRADTSGAGERDHVDVPGVDERRRNLRTGTVHNVDHAGREAGGIDRLTEQEDAERILRRRLDDGGTAGDERRRNLASHVGDREVVGSDAGDDTNRLMLHPGRHESGRAQRPLGDRDGSEAFVEIDGVRVVAEPVDRRTTDLQRLGDLLQRTRLGLHCGHPIRRTFRNLVGETPDCGAPLRGRRVLPGDGRRFGCRCSVLGLLNARLRCATDDLRGGWIDDVVGAGGRVDPFTVDQELPVLVDVDRTHGCRRYVRSSAPPNPSPNQGLTHQRCHLLTLTHKIP